MASKWSWLRGAEEKNEEKESQELPPELEERFKTVDSMKEEVSNISKRLEGLDALTSFVEEQRSSAAAAREAAEAKRTKEAEPSDEDLAAALLTNPREVINKVTDSQANAILLLRADQVRREVFEDSAESFPYYAGDLKKEVDSTLAKQPLSFRNNPESVQNVYYTIVGKHQQELIEGKLKSRFAQGSSSRGLGSTEAPEKKEIKVTPDIERAARLTGLTTADYVELLQKEEDVESYV